METLIIPFLIALGIAIVVFLIMRELVLWYFKINAIISNQKTTNDLLRKIYLLQGGKEDSVASVTTDGLKDNDEVVIKHKETGETTKMTALEWVNKKYYSKGAPEFEVIDVIRK